MDESTKLYQWYTFNYLKPNADKYHLLLSSQDKELHLTIENEKIKNSNQEKLLGITIDNNFSCIPHVRKICRQASKKLHALARICTFMTQNKRKIIMKAFIESQFNYCLLVWMFHGNRGLNDAMNKIHEQALRLVYSNTHMVPQDGRISTQEKKSRDMVRCTSIFAMTVLKRFDCGSHYGLNESFEYGKITIDKTEQSELNETEENFLKSRCVHFL